MQTQINENNQDRLAIMFSKQILLQERLGNFPLSSDNRQSFINEQSLALIDETMEALRETPWKSWKKSAKYVEEHWPVKDKWVQEGFGWSRKLYGGRIARVFKVDLV